MTMCKVESVIGQKLLKGFFQSFKTACGANKIIAGCIDMLKY